MGKSKPYEELSESYKAMMPKELNGRHRALMRKLCAGLPLKQACEELDFAYVRAEIVVNSPLFKQEMGKMQEHIDKLFVQGEAEKESIENVRDKINREAPPSLQKLIALRDSDTSSDKVQANISQDLLDRGGYKATDKVEIDARVEVGESVGEALKQALRLLREGKQPVQEKDDTN